MGSNNGSGETVARGSLLKELPVIVLLMTPVVAGVVQAWIDGATSRWVSSAGLIAITGLLALLWKRTALWSRAYLILTYAIALVGTVALSFDDWHATTFAAGPVALSQLVNGLLLAAVALSLFFVVRTRVLPRPLKIITVSFGLLFASPFVVGMWRGIELRDLFMGAGLPVALPIWLQPSVLAVGLFLPPLIVLLLVDTVRAYRNENRSAFRGILTLICAAIPFAVGVLQLPIDLQQGLVVRTFAGHSYQSQLGTDIEDDLQQSWEERPSGVSEGQPFWVESQGSVLVPESGSFEFSVAGDGQGFLYIDGERILKVGEAMRRVDLVEGVHRIRVGSIQDSDAGEFSVQWTAEGAEAAEPIDSRYLSHQAEDLSWQRSPRQAAQVGVDWLQSASVEWQRLHLCFGCHVQGQALMGLSLAEANQYDVNASLIGELERFIRAQQTDEGSIPSSFLVTSTVFGAMALAHVEANHPRKDSPELLLAAKWIAAKQQPAGDVPADHDEPPIDQGTIMTTANSLEAFRRADELHTEADIREAADKAVTWLLAANPTTNQDRTFQILGVARHGNEEQRQAVSDWVHELQELQTEEGGWKETASMNGPNAFATGQTLYAMKVAGVSVSSPSFKRGVLYLLESQRVTGLWPSVNTQQKRNSPFAPTMWAVIGLAGSFGALVPKLLSPEPGCQIVSGRVPLEATIENFTGSELATAAFQVDATPIPTEHRDGAYHALWDTASSPAGAHAVKIVVTNAAGDSAEDGTVVHTGGPPSLAFTEPVPGQAITEPITCRVTLDNPAQIPVDKVDFFLGEVSQGTDSEPPYEVPCDFTPLSDGEYVLSAIASGCATGARAELSFRIGAAPEPEPGLGRLGVRLRDVTLTVLPEYIEVVLDMSGSMWGQIGGIPKYEIAVDVLNALLEDLPEDTNFGLRVYGHRRKGDCNDSELVVKPARVNPGATQLRVAPLRPIGKTPMGRSLNLAADDLRGLKGTKAIILLTDGIETCDSDPAKVAEGIIGQGLKLRIHVVGFDVAKSLETVAQLRDIARLGDGLFILADNAEQLSAALAEAVQVTYTLYDQEGQFVDVWPVGDDEHDVMSGTYRLEVNLDPPLVLEDVVIEKDKRLRFDVILEAGRFRIERPASATTTP